MKAYFKKMAIKLLIVIVALLCNYGLLGFTVDHYDTAKSLHLAKAEVVKKQEAPKEEQVVENVEVNQQNEVETQPVSAPVPATLSVGPNNIQIASTPAI